MGCGLVLVFLRWNRGRGPIVTGLEAVGRRSLQIFCVHTVELTAIPWYLFAQQFEGRPLQGSAGAVHPVGGFHLADL